MKALYKYPQNEYPYAKLNKSTRINKEQKKTKNLNWLGMIRVRKKKNYCNVIRHQNRREIAETRDYSEFIATLRIWTRDFQIFSLTLSQLSYLGNWRPDLTKYETLIYNK